MIASAYLESIKVESTKPFSICLCIFHVALSSIAYAKFFFMFFYFKIIIDDWILVAQSIFPFAFSMVPHSFLFSSLYGIA